MDGPALIATTAPRAAADARSGLAARRVCVAPVASKDEWQALFQRVERPHLTQAWAYGEAKRASGWHPARLVIADGDRPLALCQVLAKRVLGVPILHRINRGPVFLGACDTDTVRAVMQALRQRWRALARGVLLLAPALDAQETNRRVLLDAGFRHRSAEAWHSSVLDLHKDESALRKELSATWRNRLNGSERAGMTLDVSGSADSVAWMLDRHAENMRRKKFAGPPVPFVSSLFAACPRDCLVFRASIGGEPIAGMMTVAYGRHAEYYVGWFSEAGRKLNAGNFLYWNVALELKRRGYAGFDLGGYGTRERYGKFKEGMRGAEYQLIGEWLAF